MSELRTLTWPDLVIELDEIEYDKWLEPWSWLVQGRLAARSMNRFGCWFLQRPDGRFEMLDVFFGQLEEVASSIEEFEQQMNDPSWQEVYLLSRSVLALHQADKIASGTDCYVLAPPPLIGGPDPWAVDRLETKQAMVVGAAVAQGIYSQTAERARELGHG